MSRYYVAYRDRDQMEKVAEGEEIAEVIKSLEVHQKYYIFSYATEKNDITNGDNRIRDVEELLIDDKFETEIEVNSVINKL